MKVIESESALGQPNRYENARVSDEQLADDINQEALAVVTNAQSVLERIRQNPGLKNFHDPKTNGEWMGQWLISQKRHILYDLYGSGDERGLINIPSEVEAFVTDVYQLVQE